MDGKNSAFECIITEAMQESVYTEMLTECVENLTVMKSRKIPVRIRLIAMGFLAHMSLEELNNKLQEYGCARLYSRSVWEASLIYAFHRKLSFNDYKAIESICEELAGKNEVSDQYFQESKIKVKDIRDYVDQESDKVNGPLITKHITRAMDKTLEDAALKGIGIAQYISDNLEEFRTVREKSRYYFCKYLLYYIDAVLDKIISYRELPREERDSMDILDLVALDLFRGSAEIRNGRMSREEIVETINESAISLSTIFDAFNEFFCGYVTMNWMDILMETYEGHLFETSGRERKILVKAIRACHPEWNHMNENELLSAMEEELDDRERKLDREYSKNGSFSYQQGRVGENTIRKYIKGALDIDRTTLMCFVLFFSAKGRVPRGQEINASRLSEILINSGYAGLDSENDFDYFILQYLDSKDKFYYLMEEVTAYAMQGQNTEFYQMFKNSRSQEKDVQGYFRMN